MLRGLYQAGSALQSAAANQEVAAENLAHATTPGFRRQGMTFEALVSGRFLMGDPSPAPGPGLRTGAYTTFAPAALQQTGNPLDLALSGDGFFTLEGPNGPVYTRSGVFQINGRGELQNSSGMRVSGQGGPITVPPDASEVRVGIDGAVYADRAEVGRLQLAQFENNLALRRAGTTVFEGPSPSPPAPGTLRVEQGYREGSNVEMVQELISMIIGMRQYEAAERAMRTLNEAVGLNTRPQG